IALMIHWTRGPDAAGGFLAREAIPTVSLVAVGALAAVVWSAVPPAILLLVFPLASVELAARASARARAARDQLRRSLEAQSVFAADAAHELRSPRRDGSPVWWNACSFSRAPMRSRTVGPAPTSRRSSGASPRGRRRDRGCASRSASPPRSSSPAWRSSSTRP